MRVLQVNKFLHTVGGTETVLFQTADLLKARGHEVSYFAMQDGRNRPVEEAPYFVSNVEYGAHGLRRVSERLRLPFVAGRFLHSREAAQKIEALIEERKPEIAHVHNIYHQISPSILAPLRRRGIPAVMTLHDYKMVCPNYMMFANGSVCERCKGHRYYEAFLQKCVKDSRLSSALCTTEAYAHRMTGAYAKNIAAYIAPSQFMREKMIEFGMDASRLVHLPNFLNLETYEPRYETGAYFVYAGRIERIKGISTLIEAIRDNEGLHGVELRVAGDGALRESLEQETKKAGLSGVRFLGRLPPEELGPLVQGASCVVVPSEWYENAPMSILEAFAWGKPVIASRIGGIPELVTEGRTGLLFEPGNAADLARAMAQLLVKPGLAAELGRNARGYVEMKHGADRHYEGLMALYEAARHAQPAGSPEREV